MYRYNYDNKFRSKIFDFTSQYNRGINMIKDTFLKTTVVFTLLLSFGLAQENVDAIEKARQAKEAADRAAADAAAASMHVESALTTLIFCPPNN